MSPLEIEILSLRERIQTLPESVERTLAIRAINHARSLMSRDIISASDAFARAKRFYQQATGNLRRAS